MTVLVCTLQGKENIYKIDSISPLFAINLPKIARNLHKIACTFSLDFYAKLFFQLFISHYKLFILFIWKRSGSFVHELKDSGKL